MGIANDAKSAAEMIERLSPDIVSIDLCLPYIDGVALLQMLSGNGEICKVIISDHATGSVAMVARLRSMGAAACIAKSEVAASPAAFRHKLHAIINSDTMSRALPSDEGIGLTPSVRIDMRSSVIGYPVPTDERERLDYLRRKQLANAVPERQFDLLTRHAAELSAFPFCQITFIDKDTQWAKSSYGLPGKSVPRCEAFCTYTIAQDDTFVVRNAANDAIFENYPGVIGDPHIRTYVGHPIITEEGVHVGALCVMDTKVRLVSQVLIARLTGLADLAAEMINRRQLMAA